MIYGRQPGLQRLSDAWRSWPPEPHDQRRGTARIGPSASHRAVGQRELLETAMPLHQLHDGLQDVDFLRQWGVSMPVPS